MFFIIGAVLIGAYYLCDRWFAGRRARPSPTLGERLMVTHLTNFNRRRGS